MLVAGLFGYGWNALGYGYAFTWVLGPAAIVAVIYFLGRRADAPVTIPAPEPTPGLQA
jgi:hypothetical protein